MTWHKIVTNNQNKYYKRMSVLFKTYAYIQITIIRNTFKSIFLKDDKALKK